MSDIESLKKKYLRSKYPPDPECKFCNGNGERFIENVSLVDNKPIGWKPCVCIFVSHDMAEVVGELLSQAAKRALEDLE